MVDDEAPIVPWHVQADDAVLERWLDRALSDLRGYNTPMEIVSLVTDALARFAQRESQDDDE